MKTKSVLFALLASLLLFSTSGCRRNPDFVSVSYTVENPHSTHAFVHHLDTGETDFFPSDGSERVYPASITKLLTALCALEILPADTVITPGSEVYLPGEAASSAFIRPHHTLTLEMLIEGMMIPSGDDAAYAIAAACGRAITGDDALHYVDAVSVFVDYLNKYAADLGCTGSHFTTPDGYADARHYTSLGDLLLIAQKSLENDIIMKYAGLAKDHVVYASGHTNDWVNTNRMLDPGSSYYNPHVKGIKTGSLADNYCLITYYDDGEQRLLIGVFGSETDDGRYRDTAALLHAVLGAGQNAT